MTKIGKALYTAKTHTSVGLENGVSRSSDGSLDIRLSTPGSARLGTNPEQLFAASWSAGFERALALVIRERKIILLANVVIDAEVDLNLGEDGYFLSACLNVSLPGVDREVAQALLYEANLSCPYSQAMRANEGVAVQFIPEGG